jgi:hypothetical protein
LTISILKFSIENVVHTLMQMHYPAYLFGNANRKYVECYPNSDPYFQGQTEDNVECRVCDQTHPGYCPAVMAEENELLETIISTVTDTSQGPSSEPNWLDFWSKQEIKIMQENDPSIGEI